MDGVTTLTTTAEIKERMKNMTRKNKIGEQIEVKVFTLLVNKYYDQVVDIYCDEHYFDKDSEAEAFIASSTAPAGDVILDMASDNGLLAVSGGYELQRVKRVDSSLDNPVF